MKTAMFLGIVATGIFLLSSALMRPKDDKVTAEDVTNRIEGRVNRAIFNNTRPADDKNKYDVSEWAKSHQLAS